MGNIVVKTNSKLIQINNLKEVWLQPAMMNYGIWLCYSDDEWERAHIYNSTNKTLLRDLGEKLMNAYCNGKNNIDLTTY